jgi:signal transduction histidine kinase
VKQELNLERLLEIISHDPFSRERIADFFQCASDLLCIVGPEELTSKPYIEFVHPDDRDATNAESAILKAVEGSTTNFINRYLCKDGGYRWLSWNAKTKDGYSYAIARDITDAKNTEQMLREAQKIAKVCAWKYVVPINQLWICDQSARVLGLNLAAKPTLDDLAHCYIGDASQQFQDAVQNAIKDGKQFDVDLSMETTDGIIIWYRTIGIPETINGQTVAVLGVFQDITERRQFANALERERLNSVHNAKMAALGQMAGSIAHEINNPLAVLGGLGQDLIGAANSSKTDVEAILRAAERIDVTIRRMAKIVASLKDFSRDGSSDEFIVTPLAMVVEATLGFCRERFKNCGILLQVEIPETVVVNCQSIRLSQVVLNLLNNAFDAVSTEDVKEVTLVGRVEDGKAILDVLDTGPGIPPQVAARIMEPFFTTKPPGKGTGIGLSISKGIAEEQEGTLEYVPSERGARFRLSLPAWEASLAWATYVVWCKLCDICGNMLPECIFEIVGHAGRYLALT